ncbi:MAG: hypothetical protein AVDCRST_MAG13-80, partial [uncultured Solirubrobacteraceae bacterium]
CQPSRSRRGRGRAMRSACARWATSSRSPAGGAAS